MGTTTVECCKKISKILLVAARYSFIGLFQDLLMEHYYKIQKGVEIDGLYSKYQLQWNFSSYSVVPNYWLGPNCRLDGKIWFNFKQLDPNCQLDGTFLGKINSRPYVLCSKVIQIRDSMNFNQKYLIDSMEIWPSWCNFDENINKNLESLIRHHRVIPTWD